MGVKEGKLYGGSDVCAECSRVACTSVDRGVGKGWPSTWKGLGKHAKVVKRIVSVLAWVQQRVRMGEYGRGERRWKRLGTTPEMSSKKNDMMEVELTVEVVCRWLV